MKIKKNVVVFFIAVVLVSCSPKVTVPQRADNFAFVYQDFSCGTVPVNVLDTTSGTLVYTPLSGTSSTAISLQLSDEELESIYQRAISIGFFEYPSELVVPDDQVSGYRVPSSRYQLSMVNGEMTNAVSWIDDKITKPSYKEADQLRGLMLLIDKIIQSHPEIKQLPEPNERCA
jgi:hypothetical protein